MRLRLGSLLGFRLATPGEVLRVDGVVLLLEDVGASLQEKHPEDELLELRGVHLAAEDIRDGEEMAFKLRKGQACHGAQLCRRRAEVDDAKRAVKT